MQIHDDRDFISNLSQTNLNAVAAFGGGSADSITDITVTELSDALNELAELRGEW